MTPPRYGFTTTCVEAQGDAINEMQEQARDITRRTFLAHVNREHLREVESGCGYAKHPTQGLTMAADWAVSYHRSMYCGRPCYYFCWSCIEYVFAESAA